MSQNLLYQPLFAGGMIGGAVAQLWYPGNGVAITIAGATFALAALLAWYYSPLPNHTMYGDKGTRWGFGKPEDTDD